jgi:two-component system, NarL family, sensor kinase
MLSVARIYVNTLRDQNPGGETDAQGKLGQVYELLGKAIQDLRDISKSRNADFIQRQGLWESLRFELERIARSGALKTQFGMEGDGFGLSNDQSIVLFRICQELISNSIRHSGATTIAIDITMNAVALSLRLSDDGCGFNSEGNNGTGLSNIHRRATLIGAQFSINSEPNQGTQDSPLHCDRR